MTMADETLSTLRFDNTRIDLLGTVHVSRASRKQVTQLLETGDYDTVAVELCERRHQAIVDPDAVARTDLGKVIRERKLGAMAAMLALSAYQQRLADQLETELGGEMKEAVRISRKRGLVLVLVDRDVGITLKRIYRNVPWWRRMVLLNSLLFSVFSRHNISEEQIEEMKGGDMLSAMFRDLQVLEPRLYETLITERDRYIAARIAAYVCEHRPARMLVVVGLGHLAGILHYLPRYFSTDAREPSAEIAELDQTPAAATWIKWIPWIVVAVILGGFYAGFRHNTELGLELVLDWVLINGGLAALGAAVAGAHPLTMVTAFLAAPLTSINPTIGAGMVTAAAEVYFRKPTLADFENVRKDTAHWSGWRRNRVSRTLLIFIFSTLGSALGTYIGGFHIYDSL